MLNEISVEIPRVISSFCNGPGSLDSVVRPLDLLVSSFRMIIMDAINPIGIIRIIPYDFMLMAAQIIKKRVDIIIPSLKKFCCLVR